MFNITGFRPMQGYEKHINVLNFLIRLNVFAMPLYVILFFDLSLPQLQRLIADITFSLLSTAGFNPVINDLLISIPIQNGSWGAFINWDCTAWKSMLAFFALVMATDKVMEKKRVMQKNRRFISYLDPKLKALVVFLPLIFIVNLFRIFFMFFYVRTFDLAYYSFVHAFVWSWGMIFVVLAFWILWMKKIN